MYDRQTDRDIEGVVVRVLNLRSGYGQDGYKHDYEACFGARYGTVTTKVL